MNWYIDNDGTRYRLIIDMRRDFGGRVSVTLYNGEKLTVSSVSIRIWKWN